LLVVIAPKRSPNEKKRKAAFPITFFFGKNPQIRESLL